MDDVTASIIIACQTAGAVNSISKLGFALGMLGRKAIEYNTRSNNVKSQPCVVPFSRELEYNTRSNNVKSQQVLSAG